MAAYSTPATLSSQATSLYNFLTELLKIPGFLKQFEENFEHIDVSCYTKMHSCLEKINDKIYLLKSCITSSAELNLDPLFKQLNTPEHLTKLNAIINPTDLIKDCEITVPKKWALAILLVLFQADCYSIIECVNNPKYTNEIDNCLRAIGPGLHETLKDFPDMAVLYNNSHFPVQQKLLVLTSSNPDSSLPKFNLIARLLNLRFIDSADMEKYAGLVGNFRKILQKVDSDFYQFLGTVCRWSFSGFVSDKSVLQEKFIQTLQAIPSEFKNEFFLISAEQLTQKDVFDVKIIATILQELSLYPEETCKKCIQLIPWEKLSDEAIFVLLNRLLQTKLDPEIFIYTCTAIKEKNKSEKFHRTRTTQFEKNEIELFKSCITKDIYFFTSIATLFDFENLLQAQTVHSSYLNTLIFIISGNQIEIEETNKILTAPTKDLKLFHFYTLCISQQTTQPLNPVDSEAPTKKRTFSAPIPLQTRPEQTTAPQPSPVPSEKSHPQQPTSVSKMPISPSKPRSNTTAQLPPSPAPQPRSYSSSPPKRVVSPISVIPESRSCLKPVAKPKDFLGSDQSVQSDTVCKPPSVGSSPQRFGYSQERKTPLPLSDEQQLQQALQDQQKKQQVKTGTDHSLVGIPKSITKN